MTDKLITIPRGDVVPDEESGFMEIAPGAGGIILGNVARMEELVTKVLEIDVDYGRSPGVPQPYLWDSGAAKIMAAFNLFSQHKILHQSEHVATGALTLVVETSLVRRSTGQVVATGVGAASGLEVKNKYRWEETPEDFGVDKASCQSKPGEKWVDGRKIQITKYRILNPEFGEQMHNLMKTAAKRSEIDAVQSLPGVLPVLKKLGKVVTKSPTENQGKKVITEGDITLTAFWLVVKGLNHTEDSAYKILGIKSLQTDWIKAGKRLTDAIDVLAHHAADKVSGDIKAPEPPTATTNKAEAVPDPKAGQEKGATVGDRATAAQLAEVERLGRLVNYRDANQTVLAACKHARKDEWNDVLAGEAALFIAYLKDLAVKQKRSPTEIEGDFEKL